MSCYTAQWLLLKLVKKFKALAVFTRAVLSYPENKQIPAFD